MLTSDEVVKEQTFQMTAKKDYSKSIIGNSRISFVLKLQYEIEHSVNP